MRGNRPSTTASLVGWARSVAGLGAVEVLPPATGVMARVSGAHELGRLVSDAATGGLVSHIRWRTRTIDRAVSAAVARGASQCVVVGAGFDDRAHRLTALSRLPVWEVDQPSSQGMKRNRASSLSQVAARITYVPIDLRRDELVQRLKGAGLKTDVPTVWLWEGCTMYLSVEAIRSTLERMAELSAPGSTLVSTYAIPSVAGPLTPVVTARFASLGEPLIGTVSDAAWRALLLQSGWRAATTTESTSPLFRAERVHQARISPSAGAV